MVEKTQFKEQDRHDPILEELLVQKRKIRKQNGK